MLQVSAAGVPKNNPRSTVCHRICRETARPSRVSSRRRIGGRQRAFAAAAPAAARLARLRRHEHRLALGLACLLEFFPPLREFLGRLAAAAPQHEEVESGPESLVPQEAEGTAAAPLLEARLQRPDLLHHGGEAARNGELVGLDVEHGVHRLVQSGDRFLPPLLRFLPRREHLVPQQRSEQERGRHGFSRAPAAVGLLERESDEALPHRLLDDDVEQGQQTVVTAFDLHLAQALLPVPPANQLLHFLLDPRRGHVLKQLSQLAYRFSRALVDGESGLCGKAHGAQHPQRVFPVAGARVADDAHGFPLQVPQAVVVVEEGLARGIVVQGVDREVAPDGVVLARAVDVVPEHPAMLVGLRRGARAKRRDLHGLLAEHHVHELEPLPDETRAPEDLVHLFGICVGGDVEVLGAKAQQQVAHRAAHDIRLIAVAVQHLADLARALRDRLAGDAVLLLRDGPRLGAGTEPEDAPDEFLDQEGRKLPVPSASRRHWYSASRLAWVSMSLERPRLARPASYSKTAKPQCRTACPGSCSAASTVFPPDAQRESVRITRAWW